MKKEQINLKTLKLIKINLSNKEHLQYLKEIFETNEDNSINFLGNLSNLDDNNAYIIKNDNLEKIGYFSMSEPVLNNLGLTSTSIYYAIAPEYRNNGYATNLLQEVSEQLLKNIDMLILSIDKENNPSKRVAEKTSFEIIFESDEDLLFAKYANQKKKQPSKK